MFLLVCVFFGLLGIVQVDASHPRRLRPAEYLPLVPRDAVEPNDALFFDVSRVVSLSFCRSEFTLSVVQMPIDHFASDVSKSGTFKNRYWLNATYYEAGGPVFRGSHISQPAEYETNVVVFSV